MIMNFIINKIAKQCIFNYSLKRNIFITSKILSTWSEPKGFNSGIKVYNSAISREETFDKFTKDKTPIVPLILEKENTVKWYMCGPTVYAASHIGHAVCYIRSDIVRRLLQNHFKLDVKLAMGITDIADSPIEAAKKENKDLLEFCKMHEDNFHQDMKSLNVFPPNYITRVSEYIPQIIEFCQKILEKGYAYKTEDGSLFFDSGKYAIDGFQLCPGVKSTRPCPPHKKNAEDFSLWKGAKEGEPFWETPWGKGRPGWHIECSAMASEIFGPTLDIHSGGLDLKFPHHANEICQSHVGHGTSQWVNYWLHQGLLYPKSETKASESPDNTLSSKEISEDDPSNYLLPPEKGAKMSKSIGNTTSIQDFLEEYHSNDLRLLCLHTHYRTSIEYSKSYMKDILDLKGKLYDYLFVAESYLEDIYKAGTLEETLLTESLKETQVAIDQAFRNDFNTPLVIQHLFLLIGIFNKGLDQKHVAGVSKRSPEIISESVDYIKYILEVSGMLILDKSKLSQDCRCALDAVVKSRSLVRTFALAELKAIKKNKEILSTKQATEQLKNLLSACDQLRQDLSESGIKIKDFGEVSAWNLDENKIKNKLTDSTDELGEKLVSKATASFVKFTEPFFPHLASPANEILQKEYDPRRYINTLCDQLATNLHQLKPKVTTQIQTEGKSNRV